MKPIATDKTNSLFVRKDCFDLPVEVVTNDPEYGVVVYSTWMLSEEDLQKIQRGGNIKLGIVGGQPPVILEVVENE